MDLERVECMHAALPIPFWSKEIVSDRLSDEKESYRSKITRTTLENMSNK